MADNTRAWNQPIDVKVTHDHMQRVMWAFSHGSKFELDFEDIVMAGNAIAILDSLHERWGETDDPTGAAESVVGGYMKAWAIDNCGLVDPKAEKWKAGAEERQKEYQAHLAKSRIKREAKETAKLEAAVAQRIAEMGYSTPIAAE